MLYKCLIVGLGQIGMGYDLDKMPAESVFTHAKAFTFHPSFTIVGAVDPKSSMRKIFEKHYGKPTYKSIPEATNANLIDVVIIASPTAMHAMHVKEILSHVKPLAILCEKPLAYEPAEAKTIVQECELAGVKLFVNYMRRSDPGVIEVHKRIMNGQIATPIKGTVWYSKGFFHNGSHLFNLMQFWLGSYKKHNIIVKGRLWDNLDPEPSVFVEFDRGSIVFQAAWEEIYSHYTAELVCPAGRLRYDRGGEFIQWQKIITDPNFPGYSILSPEMEIISNGMSQYQYHVVDQLSRALKGEKASICNGVEALDTIKVMHEIINNH